MTLSRALHVTKVVAANLACVGLCVVGALSPSPVNPDPARGSVAGAGTTQAAAVVERPADAGPPSVEAAGAWLTRRLGQASMPAPLAPVVEVPQTHAGARLVAVPVRPWLPPPVTPATPRASSAVPPDRLYALRTRPARDLPPVADAIAMVPPAPVRLVAPPAPRADGLDPAVVPVAAIGTRAVPSQAALTETAGWADGAPVTAAASLPARDVPVPHGGTRVSNAASEIGSLGSGSGTDDDELPPVPPGRTTPVTLPTGP